MSEAKIALVVDVKQRRPACVLIQAVYGCRSGLVSSLFDPKTWLTFPTDDMRRVEGTIEEWRRFAHEANASPSQPDPAGSSEGER